jgi:hypothetical protein
LADGRSQVGQEMEPGGFHVSARRSPPNTPAFAGLTLLPSSRAGDNANPPPPASREPCPGHSGNRLAEMSRNRRDKMPGISGQVSLTRERRGRA